MLLLIDNYDSFTHNLARYFDELGEQVKVVRNDALTLADIDALKPQRIVLSPGPCTPDDAGITLAAIAHCAGHIPLLGVCLGHQAIGQVFGARVIRAQHVMHGKTSQVEHNHSPLFEGMANPFTVTRYHSLVLDPDSLPADLTATAWSTPDEQAPRELMAIQHRSLPIWGVQFHPESVLTEHGHQLLNHFLRLSQ